VFVLDLPKLVGENECSDSDSDEEKWEEVEEVEDVEETRCLFSDKVFPSIEEALNFLKKTYNFDLSELKQKYSMDSYNYIKVS
jgi:hypothetical protein